MCEAAQGLNRLTTGSRRPKPVSDHEMLIAQKLRPATNLDSWATTRLKPGLGSCAARERAVSDLRSSRRFWTK